MIMRHLKKKSTKANQFLIKHQFFMHKYVNGIENVSNINGNGCDGGSLMNFMFIIC